MSLKITPTDKAFSDYIRTRDRWTCQRCGQVYTPPTQALHCSHFKGRRKAGTRFLPQNCDSLCYGCHSYFHQQPDEHLKWQIQRKGQEIVDAIILAANSYHKRPDLKAEKLYWQNAKKLLDRNSHK